MHAGRSPGRFPESSSPARSPRRFLWGLLAVPLLIAAGWYVASAPGGTPAPRAGGTAAAGAAPAATRPGTVTGAQSAAPCASPGGTAGAPCTLGGARIATMPGGAAGAVGPATAHPGAPGHPASPGAGAAAAPSQAAATGPAAPASAAPGSAAPDQQGTPADQVLALINRARSQAGLPALNFSAGLDQSASAHNLLMAGGCGLSHQCPGEPPIGTRETGAGVHWTSAGENIGEEGPVTGSTAAIAAAAVGLTQAMLNEQPPDDGHRLNILSTAFAHIGIEVYRSGSGTVWLTQDFSN